MARYSFRFDEATIGDLQARMESGRLTSRALVRAYLRRIDTIDRSGPGRVGLRSVLEVNPDAEPIAAALDDERRHDGPRGPLHGMRWPARAPGATPPWWSGSAWPAR